MPNQVFYIDELSLSRVAGWIDDEGPVAEIEIEIDGRWACTLSPSAHRPDLEQAKVGDGRRGFDFPLFGRVTSDSVVVIRRDGVILYQERIVNTTNPADLPQAIAHVRSQQRWRSDEPAAHLTWGRPMTGDSLWDLYQKWREFTASDRILEIGPGYGRLLKTALERGVAFASYTALELSQARVDRLTAEFPMKGVSFTQGDIDTWSAEHPLDVVICSSTFEHLHPDCRRALANIHRQLSPYAEVFIDFIETAHSFPSFEASGTYVRHYAKEELATVFAECGYAVRAIESCILGEGNFGPVKRYVVAAKQA